jgi:tetraacyldisaccharide 4'-kinase
VIAVPADELELEAELRAWGWQGPIWRLHRRMEVPVTDGPAAAFCGIARPEQFFAGLEAAGMKLAVRTVFSDHCRYSATDLDRLAAAARMAGATTLITTEKDHVRLGNLITALPETLQLKTARLHVEIEDEAAAIDWVTDRLLRAPAHPPL